jgi:hypothetical protein
MHLIQEKNMTRQQERNIAIQDGARKVMSGEQTAMNYYTYFVDHSLFRFPREYVNAVIERVNQLQG